MRCYYLSLMTNKLRTYVNNYSSWKIITTYVCILCTLLFTVCIILCRNLTNNELTEYPNINVNNTPNLQEV